MTVAETDVSAPLVLRPPCVVVVAPEMPQLSRQRSSRQRRCRRAMLWMVGLFLLGNILFGVLLDHGSPRLRDPEYGHRLECIREKQQAFPARPLVVAIGSSRMAMGVRPDVDEASNQSAGAPLPMNGSRVGAGPILQLLTLRRLLTDGVKPDRVLLEYWPALMRGDGAYREELRIDVSRLRIEDEPVIRGYFANPDATLASIRQADALPLHGYRPRLLDLYFPTWLPRAEQTAAAWKGIDGWGWLPGREAATAEELRAVRPAVASFYVPLFATYEVSALADRALRESIEVCRSRGIAVSLVVMPEASWFETLKTPSAIHQADNHLARLAASTGIPVIDASRWASDDDLPDGFHLTRAGAATFTRKFVELHLPPR